MERLPRQPEKQISWDRFLYSHVVVQLNSFSPYTIAMWAVSFPTIIDDEIRWKMLVFGAIYICYQQSSLSAYCEYVETVTKKINPEEKKWTIDKKSTILVQ